MNNMSNKKKKAKLPLRLNILFLVVFLVFSALILRLGVVQIVYGESYRNEVNRTENVMINNPVPRGKIYDTYGKIIVDNKPMNAITYTRSERTSQEERIEIAEKLARLIEKDTSKVTERDMKDYWILKNKKEAVKRLTEKEKEKLDDKEEYQLLLDRITEEDLKEIANSPKEMEILAIKRELDTGYAFTTQIVKKENKKQQDKVTDEEIATVSANLEELKGVDTTTDWDRYYVYEDTMRSILGNVTSSDQGLPAEEVDHYLSLGYNRNDRVGKSYLEYQYESVLQGQKQKVQYVTDSAGNLIDKKVLSEGRRGSDVVLTVDIELQQQVDQIVEDELKKAKQYNANFLLDRAFVVMMNPKTGEILAISGKQLITKDGKTQMVDYNQGAFTTQYEMGSAIKGATVLAGYQHGAIKPFEVQVDAPLSLAGAKPKGSYTTMGAINDLTALQRSSNVYMFKTAMKIAGVNYRPGGSLPIKPNDFETLRNYYRQFGLGVKTGIDLPNEADGQIGNDYTPGKMLDLAIGQFDTYTPLQLAQYVSTIANGGYRMKPQIVKEIREPNRDGTLSGNVIQPFTPAVLNRLDMKKEYIEQVQEGFRRVYQEPRGTAYIYFGHAPYSQYRPAGKTGTSQSLYYGPRREYWGTMTNNLTLVGYAPFEDPEVAFSIVVPWAKDGVYAINKYIGQRILESYFNLKEDRYSGASDALKPDQSVTESALESSQQ